MPAKIALLNSRLIRVLLRNWLPLALLTTILAALVYVVAQQALRLSANDPQIQMAEDTAAALAGGQSPSTLVSSSPVDLAKSLAPFLLIFDDNRQVIAGSVTLNGEAPLPPMGVFSDVLKESELRFTWQPQPGVRSAAVLSHFTGKNSGFVLAGRSLREVEKREDTILALVGIAWVVCLVSSLGLVILLEWLLNRQSKDESNI